MTRLVLINQSTGPLFFELASSIAQFFPEGALLVTGTPGLDPCPSLQIKSAPEYDRRSHFHRLRSWISYTLSVTWLLLFPGRNDVFLIVSNPPLLVPWIWLLNNFRKFRYAVLVYDLYPDVFVQKGILNYESLITDFWKKMNRLSYRRANVVITIGNRMASILERQIGTDRTAVKVIPPWADVETIRPLARCDNPYASNYVPSEKTVVLYSGNMGASHDISSILEAARLLRENSDIFFLLIGGGEKFSEVQRFIRSEVLNNVSVLPWQPQAKMLYTVPLGDIALVSVDVGMGDLMLPSKAFSYIAAGCSVVAIAPPNSELSDFVSRGKFGVRVSPRQPRALAAAISAIASDREKLTQMRLEARRAAEKYYSRNTGVLAFRDVFADFALLRRNN